MNSYSLRFMNSLNTISTHDANDEFYAADGFCRYLSDNRSKLNLMRETHFIVIDNKTNEETIFELILNFSYKKTVICPICKTLETVNYHSKNDAELALINLYITEKLDTSKLCLKHKSVATIHPTK